MGGKKYHGGDCNLFGKWLIKEMRGKVKVQRVFSDLLL